MNSWYCKKHLQVFLTLIDYQLHLQYVHHNYHDFIYCEYHKTKFNS